jgi:hypothetical protein
LDKNQIGKITRTIIGICISLLSIWLAFTVPKVYLIAFPIAGGYVASSMIRRTVEKSGIFEPNHVIGIMLMVWLPLSILGLFILFTLAFDFMSRAVPPIIALSIVFGFTQWLKTVWNDEIYTL